MAIHRLIYRLDFPLNTGIMDKPGEVARILLEEKKDFFSEVGETREWRQAAGKEDKDELVFRELTVDPRSLILSVESVPGIPSKDLLDHDSVSGGIALMDACCRVFKINHFSRAGLRLWLFEDFGRGFEGMRQEFRSQLSQRVCGVVEASLGNIGDIGLRIDGQSDAKVSFHLHVGPFHGKDEVTRYLQKRAAKFPTSHSADVVFDVDQFETNFTYGPSTIKKWCTPVVENTAKLVRDFRLSLAH